MNRIEKALYELLTWSAYLPEAANDEISEAKEALYESIGINVESPQPSAPSVSAEEILDKISKKNGNPYEYVDDYAGGNSVYVKKSDALQAMQEYAQSNKEPQPDNQDFLKYTTEARDKFYMYIKSLDWNTEMRTRVDDFLICFDQLKERYAKAQHGKDK
jgi:hypothetical protein